MKERVASQASRSNSASSGRPACPWAQSTSLDSPRPCLSGPPPILQQRLALDEAPAVFLPLTSLLPKLLEENTSSRFLPSGLALMAAKRVGAWCGPCGHGGQDFRLPSPPKFCPAWVPWLASLVSRQLPPAHPVQLHPCAGPPGSAQQPPTWLTWRIQLGIFHLRWG